MQSKYKELPAQDPGLIQLIVERYVRASDAMSQWATIAKECVEFAEGQQYTKAELAKLDGEGRPHFQFNKIGRLVRLVLGYHRNNRTDTKYLPGHDGTGIDDVAEALTHLAKHTSELNQEQYVDGEVMMDGILTGRGFYDARMDYERNDFGDLKLGAKDPFTIKIDPDCDSYDINEGNFFCEDRMVSIDEVAFTYGPAAELLLQPYIHRGGYAGMPSSLMGVNDTVMPWRTFGGGSDTNPFIDMQYYLTNAFDPYRKTIRLVDCQHYIRTMERCFIDLETGDKQIIPGDWNDARISKVLAWSESRFAAKGQASPIIVGWRPMRRVRWTTLVGDMVVWDGWSPYSSFTVVGYFPWFRRGKTKGMVDDLLDPQREINKRRNSNIEMVAAAGNSGWQYHADSLSEDQKERLEAEGSAPGYNQEWKGDVSMKPNRIEPGSPPTALERLEDRANGDLNEISGINESALGEIDKVQSGVAVEARQRQAVISIQMYMDNNSRTKELLARKKLEIYQSKYDTPRTISILGDDGKVASQKINEEIATGEILNNITLGKYRVVIDETPLSASYLSAQFTEAMEMVEKGVLNPQLFADDLIDMSSLPRKDILKKKQAAVMKAQGLPTTQDLESGNVAPMLPAPGAAPEQTGAPGAPPTALQSLTTDAQGNTVANIAPQTPHPFGQ